MRSGHYRGRERAKAQARLLSAGVDYATTELVLRDAAKLARLAEAQCNGDWPADNGERKVKEYSQCKCLWTPGSLTRLGVCQDCRAATRIKSKLAPFGVYPDFAGDPRGYVVTVLVPDLLHSIERENESREVGLA